MAETLSNMHLDSEAKNAHFSREGGLNLVELNAAAGSRTILTSPLLEEVPDEDGILHSHRVVPLDTNPVH